MDTCEDLRVDRLLNGAKGLEIVKSLKKHWPKNGKKMASRQEMKLLFDKVKEDLEKKKEFLTFIVMKADKAGAKKPDIFTASHYVKQLQTIPTPLKVEEGEYKGKYISTKYKEKEYYDTGEKVVEYHVVYNDPLGKEKYRTFTPRVEDGVGRIFVSHDDEIDKKIQTEEAGKSRPWNLPKPNGRL